MTLPVGLDGCSWTPAVHPLQDLLSLPVLSHGGDCERVGAEPFQVPCHIEGSPAQDPGAIGEVVEESLPEDEGSERVL